MKIQKLINMFNLQVLSTGEEDIKIKHVDTNRVGLQLGGFYGHFHENRIQIIGQAESDFLETLSKEEYDRSLETLIDKDYPCLILTSGTKISPKMIEYGQAKDKWILATETHTSEYLINQTLFLQNKLAPKIMVHGVLLDLFGMGVLIKGDSGVGKSITAIELIRRGHLFIADDVVVIKKLSNQLLVGEPEKLTKNLIECRGVGIVNINSLFGKSSVRQSATIDLIIHLHGWDEHEKYEGIGEVIETDELFGVELPIINIPVKPGQLIPTSIIEIGALNIRQNQMGYNTAQELLKAVQNMSH